MYDQSGTTQNGDVATAGSGISKVFTDNSVVQTSITTSDSGAIKAGADIAGDAIKLVGTTIAANVDVNKNALSEALGFGKAALNFADKEVQSSFAYANAAQAGATATTRDAFALVTSAQAASAKSYDQALGLGLNLIDSANKNNASLTASAISSIGNAYKEARDQENTRGIADYRIMVMGVLVVAGLFFAAKAFKG